MKTPAFWQGNHPISDLLLPAAVLYGMAGTIRRLMAKPVRLPVPVICVGNVTAGGGGKTPVAIAIGERLKAKGVNAFFLSRGYGGKSSGPLRVDTAKHGAREVGDEPLLLSRTLPTVIARDRLRGARMAVAQGASAIIMDDGFQNPAIAKTLSLLVIDGGIGMGNNRLMPAGPLRESLSSALKRADAVALLNPGTFALPSGITPLVAHSRADKPELKGRRVYAFCGLAWPEKFFATLEGLGAEIAGRAAFADHHFYTGDELAHIGHEAERLNAIPVTTAKDAVRLSPEARSRVTVVDIAVEFEKPDALDVLLDSAMGRA